MVCRARTDALVSLSLPVHSQFSDEVFIWHSNSIIFPDQSTNEIMKGYAPGTRPKENVGGVGKEGVEKLKQFVKDGGTLVFMNRSSDLRSNSSTYRSKTSPKTGLDVTFSSRVRFSAHISILHTELPRIWTKTQLLGSNVRRFSNSVASRKKEPSRVVVAKYPDNPDEILLAGWALGKEKLAGKAAIVEVKMGNGKIVLFGFRPQYRGQSRATYPLLFNAITY